MHDTPSDFWTDAIRRRVSFKAYTPAELGEAAVGYFNWCADNPLYEMDLRTADGCVVETPVAKVRAFTRRGLILWLGISRTAWDSYRNDPDYSDIAETIENVIYTQKFEHAAAGLLNANIIARDLGLADNVKSDHTSSDGSMTPKGNLTLDVSKLSPQTKMELLAATDDADSDDNAE